MPDQKPIDALKGFAEPGQRLVGPDVFEEELEAVLSACDPQVGILGPDSVSWEVFSQTAVWFGAMRANLLQTTHPGVATALVEKSKADTSTRLETTIAFVDGVVFGTVEQARELAHMLHGKHMAVSGRIKVAGGVYAEGDAYEGNDLEALWWVLATLIDTAVTLYDLFIRALSPAEKDRLIGELPPLGAMFGIPRSVLPADWASFRAYFTAMLEGPRTAITDTSRAAAANVLAVSGPSPMLRLVRAMTIGWLPPAVREGYGLRWDAKARAVSAAGHQLVRAYLKLQRPEKRRAQGFLDARIRLGLSPLP